MTHAIPVTLLYGSLTALLVAALGANVSRLRGAKKSFIGDTPDSELQRTIRAHGNATEWAPLMIVMLMVLELAGASSQLLHVAGGTIVAARLLHAFGVLQKNSLSAVGASLTYIVSLGLPIYALVLRFR
jgi:uncharacterized protein